MLKGKIGKQVIKLTYEYDKSGRMIKSYDSEGKTINNFNELGQIISSDSYYGDDNYYSLKYEYEYEDGVLENRTEYEFTDTDPEWTWSGDITIESWQNVYANYKALRCARYIEPFIPTGLQVYDWE